MLCAKYQEAALCGSREKCDRNYLVSKFSYVHNIQSRVKQEVDMPQMDKLACVVPEKNVTDATQDDRSDPYMSPPLKRAGDTIII